jgi:ADP-ribose pyrophosphatase
MDREFQRLGREEIYNGRVIRVVKDKLLLPNGKEADWDLVQHNGAAAVVAIDDEGKILLVHQYRNAANTVTLEIPAGTLEKGEDPLVCAKRELEEETGFKTDDFEFLIRFYTAIGFCDEMIHIYVAKGLKPSRQNLDEDEFVTVESYSLDELFDMIYSGKIIDAKTISSILAYAHKYSK